MFKEKKSKDPKRQEEKNKTRREQEAYLHPRIIKAEKCYPYNVSLIYYKESDDRTRSVHSLKAVPWRPFSVPQTDVASYIVCSTT